jgi:hypothetical protein
MRNAKILDGKAVKLVTVDGQVLLAGVRPFILLIYAYAHQVRHHFREAKVVVAFHPDHFNVMLGI